MIFYAVLLYFWNFQFAGGGLCGPWAPLAGLINPEFPAAGFCRIRFWIAEFWMAVFPQNNPGLDNAGLACDKIFGLMLVMEMGELTTCANFSF